MKKRLAGIGAIAIALILTLCFSWHDTSDQVSEKSSPNAKVQKAAKAKKPGGAAEAVPKKQADEKASDGMASLPADDSGNVSTQVHSSTGKEKTYKYKESYFAGLYEQ